VNENVAECLQRQERPIEQSHLGGTIALRHLARGVDGRGPAQLASSVERRARDVSRWVTNESFVLEDSNTRWAVMSDRVASRPVTRVATSSVSFARGARLGGLARPSAVLSLLSVIPKDPFDGVTTDPQRPSYGASRHALRGQGYDL
jgi:hypothetical protein